MVRVSEVADGVFQIHPELNFMFSLSYLVTGKKPVLIDPGSTTQAGIVLRAIKEELEFDLSSIEYIIPTHLHIDHGGGAGYAARELPRAKVAVFERHARHLIDPTMLVDTYKQTFGENFADKFGPVLAVPENQIFTLGDGDTVDLGGRQLKVIYTRGHANHHFCLYDDKSGGLFCGDTAGMYFPDVDGVVIVCPEGFDLDLQLGAIEHLRVLDPRLLFYAHEGTGHQPDELMQRAAQELKDCGDLILKALKAGENSRQVKQQLNSYFQSNVSGELNYEKMYLDLTVAGYRKCFEKNGQLCR